MRRRRFQILGKQSPQHRTVALAALRRQGNGDLRFAQRAIAVGRNIQRHRLRRSVARRRHRQLLFRRGLGVARYFSLQVQERRSQARPQSPPAARTSPGCAGSRAHLRQLGANGGDSCGDRLRHLLLVLGAGNILHVIVREERSRPQWRGLQCCSSAATAPLAWCSAACAIPVPRRPNPATDPLRSRNAACAVSQGKNPCRDRLIAGSIAVKTCTPRPVLAACKVIYKRRARRIHRHGALVQ